MSDGSAGARVHIELFSTAHPQGHVILGVQFPREPDVGEIFRREMLSVGAVKVSPDLDLPDTPVSAAFGLAGNHLGLVTLVHPDGNISRIVPPRKPGGMGRDWIRLALFKGAMLLWLPSDMIVDMDMDSVPMAAYRNLWHEDVLAVRASALRP